MGLKVTGVIGILLTAKELGLEPAIKPLLDELETKAGFWLSKELRQYVLKLADEMP